MAEVAWFTATPPAVLVWDDATAKVGHLSFVGPDGGPVTIHVTSVAAKRSVTNIGDLGGNVWLVTVAGTVATVSPEINFAGRWKTPKTVKFNLVSKL